MGHGSGLLGRLPSKPRTHIGLAAAEFPAPIGRTVEFPDKAAADARSAEGVTDEPDCCLGLLEQQARQILHAWGMLTSPMTAATLFFFDQLQLL
jgi:hypothetical protein